MVGIMLGVTAIIVTISVMNGFRENLFIAVTGTTPHLRLLAGGQMHGRQPSIEPGINQHGAVALSHALASPSRWDRMAATT